MATLSVFEQARHWLDHDPDPATRGELSALIAQAESGSETAQADLADRFAGHLTFGTAGLRAELGAGPMRMNRVVVAHAAAGLGRFLLERSSGPLHVVVAGDARHNSDVFARDTAEILSAMGIRVSLFESPVPTPVLAFAVRHESADAGVMVTASHNPPGDNGYKVYLGGPDNGSQIIPPSDEEIRRQILHSHATTIISDLPRSDETIGFLGETTITSYIDQLVELAGEKATTPLRLCYTPLHGVGRDITLRALAAVGFHDVVVVSAQGEPDPTFPTVNYPNPEEPGALDLAYQTATEAEADLIIAHDPDADRLAVAIPAPHTSATPWRMLTGNELGALLLASAAETAHQRGVPGTIASSLVSSPIFGAIATTNGLEHWESPTGFKWISRAPSLIAGCEEALGYLVAPEMVSDKDGISAAVFFALLASRARGDGHSVAQLLEQLMDTYGGFASDQITLRLDSPEAVSAVMAEIRSQRPVVAASLQARTVDDFVDGLGDFPPANMLRFSTVDDGRIIIRPSGTEPKLKVYVDALASSHSDATALVRSLRQRVMGALEPFGVAADAS